jgi:glycosyltransferase involved in cell wall biosynthesis
VVRALVVTNMYPTPVSPYAGPFIAEQVESLRSLGVEVDVLHFPRHELGRSVYRDLGRTVRQRIASTDPDLVHVAYGGVMAEAVTRSVRDRPVLVTFHGTDLLAGKGDGLLDGIGRWVGLQASRRAARRAAGVIAVSSNIAEALPRSIDRSRVWVVPNGVDMSLFRPRDRLESQEALGWDPANTHVLFPASPSRPEKRFGLAEATVALLQRNGAAVELHALDGVAHEEVPTWINASSAVLLTSSHEGSPVVVKEALACNVPVVSVDVGDVRARIEGIDGCSIAEPNAADLAAKLELALGRKAPVNGRDRIAELSLERVGERIREIYSVVADGAGDHSSEPLSR